MSEYKRVHKGKLNVKMLHDKPLFTEPSVGFTSATSSVSANITKLTIINRTAKRDRSYDHNNKFEDEIKDYFVANHCWCY